MESRKTSPDFGTNGGHRQCLSLHRYEKLQKKNSALEAIKKKKVLNVCE